MATPVFVPADPIDHREVLIEINLEYVSWVFAQMAPSLGVSPDDIVGMPVRDYVASTIPKVCGESPPRGAFYLIELDGAVAGMGGLRFVRDGVAEFKRVYVRPAHRGLGLAALAIRRLKADALAFGYHTACLDTAPFMHAAQRLYETHGFVDCEPYEGVEVPVAFRRDWRFMQCALNDGAQAASP